MAPNLVNIKDNYLTLLLYHVNVELVHHILQALLVLLVSLQIIGTQLVKHVILVISQNNNFTARNLMHV